MTQTKQFDAWQRTLREVRIKPGVDYAVAQKYGELRVYCNVLFHQTIVDTAAQHGLTISSIATWADYPGDALVDDR